MYITSGWKMMEEVEHWLRHRTTQHKIKKGKDPHIFMCGILHLNFSTYFALFSWCIRTSPFYKRGLELFFRLYFKYFRCYPPPCQCWSFSQGRHKRKKSRLQSLVRHRYPAWMRIGQQHNGTHCSKCNLVPVQLAVLLWTGGTLSTRSQSMSW